MFMLYRKMSCSIRDASLTTSRRRQLALYAWRNENQFPQNPQSIYPEQRAGNGPNQSGPESGVGVQAFIGAQVAGQAPGGVGSCGCSSAVTLQGYSKNSPGR
jgi:hypothetical protein